MALEDDIAAAFARACRERDLELAEFMFQALEAIAKREGSDERVDSGFGELLQSLLIAGAHYPRRGSWPPSNRSMLAARTFSTQSM